VADPAYLNLKDAQGGIGSRIALSTIRAARRLGFARLKAGHSLVATSSLGPVRSGRALTK
jgi:hypothetical protein